MIWKNFFILFAVSSLFIPFVISEITTKEFSSKRIDFGPVEDDENSDGPPKNPFLSEVNEDSDDMKDAEPTLRATLKAYEKKFKEAFIEPGQISDKIDFEKIKQLFPQFEEKFKQITKGEDQNQGLKLQEISLELEPLDQKSKGFDFNPFHDEDNGMENSEL